MLSFQQDVCDAPATAPEANQQWIPMAELQADQMASMGSGQKTSKNLVFFGKIRLRTSTDGPTILFWSAGAGHRNIVKTQFLLTSLWIRSLPMIFHSWESTCFDHVNDQWTIWRDLSCFVSSLGDWLAGSGEGNEEVHIKLCRGWWPQSVYGCWNGFMIRSHWRVPLQ